MVSSVGYLTFGPNLDDFCTGPFNLGVGRSSTIERWRFNYKTGEGHFRLYRMKINYNINEKKVYMGE